jgi:hypothetical protein
MNDEVYYQLDCEEIIKKDHYYRNNNELVLLPSNHPYIGKKVEYEYIFEKVSLEDFRILKDDEIVNKEHFYVWRDIHSYLIMSRCRRSVGRKAGNARNYEYNIYAKKKTQFNFETLNILKDIEL